MVPFRWLSDARAIQQRHYARASALQRQCGLFDVSHMGQIIVEGEGAAQALEKLMPVDLESLGSTSKPTPL